MDKQKSLNDKSTIPAPDVDKINDKMDVGTEAGTLTGIKINATYPAHHRPSW
jgi:hypothetical protein